MSDVVAIALLPVLFLVILHEFRSPFDLRLDTPTGAIEAELEKVMEDAGIEAPRVTLAPVADRKKTLLVGVTGPETDLVLPMRARGVDGVVVLQAASDTFSDSPASAATVAAAAPRAPLTRPEAGFMAPTRVHSATIIEGRLILRSRTRLGEAITLAGLGLVLGGAMGVLVAERRRPISIDLAGGFRSASMRAFSLRMWDADLTHGASHEGAGRRGHSCRDRYPPIAVPPWRRVAGPQWRVHL